MDLVDVYTPVLSRVFFVSIPMSICLGASISIDAPVGTPEFTIKTITFIFGFTLALVLAVWAVLESVARFEQHRTRLFLHQPQVIEPEEVEAIPFPPVGFVDYIWNFRDEHGKFPTIDECEASGYNRQMAQDWFQMLRASGAIVNRTAKKYAGDPAPGWDRARFIQAAEGDNILHYPSRLPIPKAI